MKPLGTATYLSESTTKCIQGEQRYFSLESLLYVKCLDLLNGELSYENESFIIVRDEQFSLSVKMMKQGKAELKMKWVQGICQTFVWEDWINLFLAI